jgi:long-chain acyl-CoA synthetase
MAHQSLAELFLSQADRNHDRILYRFFRDDQWQSYSWQEVAIRVRESGLGLVAMGIKKGDRVAILSANRVEWCLIDWANICIGALTVPLYPSSTPAQIRHLLAHSGAKALVVDSPARWTALNPFDPSLSELKLASFMDSPGETPPGHDTMQVLSLERLQEIGRQYGEANPQAFDRLAGSLRPEDDLTIIYTSGTTGEPKGVLTTHSHYLFAIEAFLEAVPCTTDDVALQFLPLVHAFGRLEHFTVVARGMFVRLLAPPTPSRKTFRRSNRHCYSPCPGFTRMPTIESARG